MTSIKWTGSSNILLDEKYSISWDKSKRIKDINMNQQDKLINRHYYSNLSEADFFYLLSKEWSNIIADSKNGKKEKFKVDNENRFIIRQLYNWITLNENFEVRPGKKGNLNSGILLLGNVGCGKTSLMEAFCNVYQNLSKKNFTRLYSATASDNIIRINVENLKKRLLFIDDLGRETLLINDYGTKIKPMVKLIEYIYLNSSIRMGTSNYVIFRDQVPKDKKEEIQTLEDIYEYYIATRIAEIFNVMVLHGNNRRKR